jgi:ketosteroid isomerase-like protein
MANGAIGPFRGVPDASGVSAESRSTETMKQYYHRVWNKHEFDAIDDLVAENFKIHRDGLVLSGRKALKATVRETQANFLDLKVDLEGIVALGDTVAIRLNVWHRDSTNDQKWLRFKGVDISTVKNGHIVETSVSYGPSESFHAAEAHKLMPR